MRRCLRAFLVGLLTLSLLTAPAHACWRTRQARQCPPACVVPACPPPAVGWGGCWTACGETVVVVSDVCVASSACCGEVVRAADAMAADAPAVESADVAGEAGAAVAPATERAVPTPAVAAEKRATTLEPVAPPPALEPAGEPVTRASNEQPVLERRDPVVEPEPAVRRGELPAEEAVAGEPPAARPELGAEEPAPAVPAEEEAFTPPAEPPMEEDVPAADVADEPAPEAPVVDEPVAPEPAPEAPAPVEPEEPAADDVKPAPAEDTNIFDELDGDDAAAPAAADGEAADAAEPAAADPFGEAGGADAADDAMPADDAAPPAADDLPADEPLPPQDEPAGEGEPADPFADDSAPAAEPPAGESTEPPADPAPADDPLAEPPADEAPADDEPPAAADPFAASEPLRRWIDATGTASIVGTLVDVGGDGRCVLETRGRRIIVPLANLSPHDRDYVRHAGIRLAKVRTQAAGETVAAPAPAPAVTDTAAL